MARGYMGSILNIDLGKGTIEEEELDEKLCRDYIGGYGLGAKLLYDRMPRTPSAGTGCVMASSPAR
jgi:aldehyde:ferredoxin oxidoreductase